MRYDSLGKTSKHSLHQPDDHPHRASTTCTCRRRVPVQIVPYSRPAASNRVHETGRPRALPEVFDPTQTRKLSSLGLVHVPDLRGQTVRPGRNWHGRKREGPRNTRRRIAGAHVAVASLASGGKERPIVYKRACTAISSASSPPCGSAQKAQGNVSSRRNDWIRSFALAVPGCPPILIAC